MLPLNFACSIVVRMKLGPDEVVLDLNTIARDIGQDVDLGTAVVSRDQSMVCYTLDRSADGSEYYSLHIKCLRSGKTLVWFYFCFVFADLSSPPPSADNFSLFSPMHARIKHIFSCVNRMQTCSQVKLEIS